MRRHHSCRYSSFPLRFSTPSASVASRGRGAVRRENADPRVMEYFPATLTEEESDQGATSIEAGIEVRRFGFRLDHATIGTSSGSRPRLSDAARVPHGTR